MKALPPSGAGRRLVAALAVSAILSILAASPCSAASPRPSGDAARVISVYDGQPAAEEKEILRLLKDLPRFRRWARENGETVQPAVRRGRPDLPHSERAAAWAERNGWDARRFFCVMGRMAAATALIAEGEDAPRRRPPDMPDVAASEMELARRHLAALLNAGGEGGGAGSPGK